MGCQSDTIITIGVPDLGRCVHLDPTRSVGTGYDCGPDVFHDHDQG